MTIPLIVLRSTIPLASRPSMNAVGKCLCFRYFIKCLLFHVVIVFIALYSSVAMNKTTSKLPAALRESVNFHEDEMFVGFCDKKVEKNYKFFSEINHDGKNSVLYPLDTLKRREIAFAVNKISPECFENGIYK